MRSIKEKYLALSGGIGGAKLALGLSRVLDGSALTIIANTGDDFEHLGLYISPDVDTLLYTLAGINNKESGWGRADETWNFFATARELGMESWFQLGDKDIALHLYRTNRLRQGISLSAVVQELASKLGIALRLVPMSDAPVRTMVDTEIGVLAFQEYFVKHRCEPKVKGIRFAGSETAQPSGGFRAMLEHPALCATIICPSNPLLSIQPILSLPGLEKKLSNSKAPVIVVSPLVRGQALKGPTAKMMQELGLGTGVPAIARLYQGIAQGIVIDSSDAAYSEQLEALGLQVLATNIVMETLADKIRLAEELVQFAREFSGQ